MKKILKTIATSVSVTIMAFFGSIIVSAFTMPTAQPPQNNVPSPLNQTGFYQEKTGELGATLFFDTDTYVEGEAPLHYFDPSGTSVIKGSQEIGAPESDRVVSIQMGSADPAQLNPANEAHIINVADPVSPQDAANKRFVDSLLGL